MNWLIWVHVMPYLAISSTAPPSRSVSLSFLCSDVMLSSSLVAKFLQCLPSARLAFVALGATPRLLRQFGYRGLDGYQRARDQGCVLQGYAAATAPQSRHRPVVLNNA